MSKKLLALMMMLVLLVSVIAGCGAAASKAGRTSNRVEETKAAVAPGDAVEMQFSEENEAGAPAETPKAKEDNAGQLADGKMDATAVTGGGNAAQNVSNAILAERKIIRKANVTIEVDNFDFAYGKINTFITGIGFISESNINTDKVYVQDALKLVRRGVIVVRVDRDKFDKVYNDVLGLGTVLNQSMGTEDVTEKFFDIDSRLRLLKFEEGRLEEYLKKQTDPDIIFKTESRLTDIRHEIEGLTGTLRKLSDLVDLSTITININEKIPGSDQAPPTEKPYWKRLLDNFLDSIKGVVTFCGELLILVVQAIPVLILLGIFAVVVLFIYRRISRNTAALKKKDNDSQM